MRLEDEVAAEAIKEASRAYVEDVLGKGIASTKKRTRVRDHTEAVRVRPPPLIADLHQEQAETAICVEPRGLVRHAKPWLMPCG